MSLLDLVAPQARRRASSKLLKQLSKGEAPPPRYETRGARRSTAASFPAVMEFTPATYEGETCLQIVFRRQETRTRNSRAKSRSCASATRSPACSTAPTFLRALEDAVAGTAAERRAPRPAAARARPLRAACCRTSAWTPPTTWSPRSPQRLRSARSAPNDVAARFGEHQFAVLARNSDHEQHHALAENAARRLRRRTCSRSAAARSTPPSASAACRSARRSPASPQILAKASQGLQSAIGVGGNRVEIFDPGARRPRRGRARRRPGSQRIRDALDGDQFVLHYQPVISLHGDAGRDVRGAAAHAGRRPARLVQPLTFLPIAEEHGLLWRNRPLGGRPRDPPDRRPRSAPASAPRCW